MTPRRRVAVSLIVTALAVIVVGLHTVQRLSYWHERGWAGFNYIAFEKSASGKNPLSIESGRVLIVFPGGAAYRAGMRGGDTILTINGTDIHDAERLDAVDRAVRTGSVVDYRVRRGGVERLFRVRFQSPLVETRTQISSAVSLVLAGAFLAIAVLVLWQRPDDRRAQIFFWMATVGALSFLVSISSAIDASNLRGIISNAPAVVPLAAAASLVGMVFIVLTLHLALIFPRERAILVRRPYVLRWVYALPLFAAANGAVFASVAFAAASPRYRVFLDRFARDFFWQAALVFAVVGVLLAVRLSMAARAEGGSALLRRPIQTILVFFAAIAVAGLLLHHANKGAIASILIVLAALLPLPIVFAYPLLSCISLFRSYREANAEERRQVKWPLWGTLIAIGSRVIMFVLGMSVGIYMSMTKFASLNSLTALAALEYVPRLAYLLIPISFAFAILKYRLMEIDVLIKKTVVYTILSGAIVVVYLGVVGGLGTVLVDMAGVENRTMVIASTLLVALLFVPVRNKLQFLVDRNLFRQKYDYGDALRAIAAETVNAKDETRFLTFAAEKLQQVLQNRFVAILVSKDDEFVTAAKIGLPDGVVGALRVPRSAASADATPLRKINTARVVPVHTDALIALGAKLSDRAFDDEDSSFLESAAGQIDVGLDRIRLGREEIDFEQARQVQLTLLPREMPHVEGLDVHGMWQPARTVGGDYYDVLKLSETQLAVCIGDVAGKGMPAALLMSSLQAAVRASAGEDTSPADVCSRVRRVVLSSLTGGRFVTFFYCAVDIASRRIRWCNGGHNPPVLVRADGTVVHLSDGGPAISRLLRDQPYTSADIELRAGDRLVLFTDGASEARDAHDTQYGEERIASLAVANRHLDARALVGSIAASVSAFSGARAEDDLTLVALAVTLPE